MKLSPNVLEEFMKLQTLLALTQIYVKIGPAQVEYELFSLRYLA